MIKCCKCGGDCGPGEGVSMCFGCNELKDMEVQDRSYQKETMISQSELLDLINSARLALLANGVFHTPVALRKSGNAEWDQYQIDAIHRTRNFLASTKKFGEVKVEQQ